MRKPISYSFIFAMVLLSCNKNLHHKKGGHKSPPIFTTSKTEALNCDSLSIILKNDWKIGSTLHSTIFNLYQRNDTLVDKYIIGRYKKCLIGLSSESIITKFGTPTYNSNRLMYYETLAESDTSVYQLKFWIAGDTVNAIQYMRNTVFRQ